MVIDNQCYGRSKGHGCDVELAASKGLLAKCGGTVTAEGVGAVEDKSSGSISTAGGVHVTTPQRDVVHPSNEEVATKSAASAKSDDCLSLMNDVPTKVPEFQAGRTANCASKESPKRLHDAAQPKLGVAQSGALNFFSDKIERNQVANSGLADAEQARRPSVLLISVCNKVQREMTLTSGAPAGETDLTPLSPVAAADEYHQQLEKTDRHGPAKEQTLLLGILWCILLFACFGIGYWLAKYF